MALAEPLPVTVIATVVSRGSYTLYGGAAAKYVVCVTDDPAAHRVDAMVASGDLPEIGARVVLRRVHGRWAI